MHMPTWVILWQPLSCHLGGGALWGREEGLFVDEPVALASCRPGPESWLRHVAL